MTIINQNSISGITSITAASGSVQIFNSDGSSGSLTDLSGINVVGVVTATSFVGDGSNLTGIDATQIVTGNTSVQTVDTGSNGHIKFNTEGSEVARFDSSGRFGVGTAIPAQALTVGGVSATPGDYKGLAFQSGSTEVNYIRSVVQDGNNIALTFGTYGSSSLSEKARLTAAGQFLVGTSTARANFFNSASGQETTVQIEGTTGGTSSFSLTRNTNGEDPPHLIFGKTRGTSVGSNTVVQSGDRIGLLDFQGADGSEMVRAASIETYVDGTPGANDMPGRLVFSTTADAASSPTERMRITNNGYSKHKGGGANYYSDTANYHEFTSNQTSNVVLEVVARTTSFASDVIQTVVETTTNNTSYTYFAGANYNGLKAAIYGNGTYGSATNTYGSLSDIKLKENIVPASSQWDDVKTIEVVNYNLIGEDDKHIGVIAQQAGQISPGLVDEIPDKDADGNLTGETTKFVKYSVLYMKSVKALQEAMERIETLEAANAAQAATIAALDARLAALEAS